VLLGLQVGGWDDSRIEFASLVGEWQFARMASVNNLVSRPSFERSCVLEPSHLHFCPADVDKSIC